MEPQKTKIKFNKVMTAIGAIVMFFGYLFVRYVIGFEPDIWLYLIGSLAVVLLCSQIEDAESE